MPCYFEECGAVGACGDCVMDEDGVYGSTWYVLHTEYITYGYY